jgi:maltose alpha-D-glucosyltransferase/alpha-amylase
LGILQQFVENQGDAWEYTLDQVSTYYERAATVEHVPPVAGADVASIVAASLAASSPGAETIGSADGNYVDIAYLLGQRTGELHRALANVSDPAFAPEPFTALYQRSLYQTMRTQAGDSLATLALKLGELPEAAQDDGRAALSRGGEIQQRMRGVMGQRIDSMRIRCHGDLHLGQVLWTGRDFVFIDFEGEPGRPMVERRHKRSALTDVAGMLRSFHYAALGTLVSDRVGGVIRPDDVQRLTPWADLWYRTVAATFLRGYREAAAGASFMPRSDDELTVLLSTSMLHKVMYELSYELNNRPDWVAVPLRGLLDLLGPAGQA